MTRLTPTLDWTLDEAPQAADLAVITDGVTAHGRAQAGDVIRPIACFVRAQGRIVAGGHGRTELQRLFVHYLWVDAGHRRQGLASEVLRRLEVEAQARGCLDAALETLEDDTAAFYGRRGWRTVGLVPRWVGRFNRHLMVKPLVDAGTVRIQLERADQPEVIALIDALDAYQQPLYPPESHHGIDIAALTRPEVLMAVVRNADSLAVGCGALVLAADGHSGELKRMFLLPAWRGGGRAKALLAFLEQAGAKRGCRTFQLETGIHQQEALAFYTAAGYGRRGPFGDYAPDPLSVFMERTLAP
jgi:putative acetyltransferase